MLAGELEFIVKVNKGYGVILKKGQEMEWHPGHTVFAIHLTFLFNLFSIFSFFVCFLNIPWNKKKYMSIYKIFKEALD